MHHTEQPRPKQKEQPAREDRSKEADAGAAPEQSDRRTAPGEPDDTPEKAGDPRKPSNPPAKR